MNEEPSVLDYIKALLTPWRGKPPQIQPEESHVRSSPEYSEADSTFPGDVQSQGVPVPLAQVEEGQPLQSSEASSFAEAKPVAEPTTRVTSWPWRSLLGLGLGLIAQRSLEPGPDRTWTIGLPLYLIAAAWVGWAGWRGEWKLAPQRSIEYRVDLYSVRQNSFWIGSALALLTFLTLGKPLIHSIFSCGFCSDFFITSVLGDG
jgi:hypothetical protein